MRQYKQFGKKEFEYGLRGVLIRNRLGFLDEITFEYRKENPMTWERMYTISTANRAVKVLVFSSIDLRTDTVREHGEDAVRLVMRWETKNGMVYKSVSKHLRIETLFDNIEKSLLNIKKEVFDLKYKEFKSKEDLV